MRVSTRILRILGIAAVLAGGWPRFAESGSHLWRFTEAFSNEDGTIQFLEMKESYGSPEEIYLQNKWILAVNADHKVTFRSNLTGNTANRYLLLATSGFAALPGAPTPDVIIPNGFLPLGGDVLEYWLYPEATWTYPALPQDGVSSVGPDGTPAVNSPTNYEGETGTIDLTVPTQRVTWGSIKSRTP